MKKLKILTVLEFYDIPQLFICEDNDNKYLCMTYSYDKNDVKCIGVVISDDQLKNYLNRDIDLRSVFTDTGISKFDVTINNSTDVTAISRKCQFEEYMLPEAGFYSNC